MSKIYELESIPTLLPSAQLIRKDNEVYLKKDLELFHLPLSPKILAIILNTVDGIKSVRDIGSELGSDFNEEDLLNFFEQLEGKLFSRKEPDNDNPDKEKETKSEVVIIGNGKLGSEIFKQLEHLNWANPKLVCPESNTLSNKTSSRFKLVTSAELGRIIEISKIVIVTLEDVKYDVYFKINEKILEEGIPCLFIIPGHSDTIIGPSAIPGKTACFECFCKSIYYPDKEDLKEVVSQFKTYLTTDWGKDERSQINRIAHNIVTEVTNVLGHAAKIDFLFTHYLERLAKDGTRIDNRPLLRQTQCACSTSQFKEINTSLGQRIDFYLSTIHKTNPNSTYHLKSRTAKQFPISKIGIVGGGTAGYLTAMAIRKKYPAISVEVIESSKIPVIGVGEGTTPFIRHFLHGTLGIDISEFFEKAKPTWKLGVKFLWGKPETYHFNYPFGNFDTLPALIFEKDINKCSLNSMLMERDGSPVIKNENEGYEYLTEHLRYAYHLDNRLFASYLKMKTIELGVEIFDTKIVEVVTEEDKSRIQYLVNEQGEKIKYDLYIDCSGFKSLLMGEALSSPFIDFKSSLYTNTALIAKGPLDLIRPYTQSETMSNGWSWSIPTQQEYHYGYVFSSDFCTVDEAWDEMSQKKAIEGEPRVVKFRTGRHENFWKGNVVAIGNSYGFVEPLEATGIHMIIEGIENLIQTLPQTAVNSSYEPFINKKIGDHWDYLRWFLSLHYKFNKRSNSDFWKTCNEDCDVSGIQDLLNLYWEAGPLSNQSQTIKKLIREQFPDKIFGPHGFDHILLGQGSMPKIDLKTEMNRQLWISKLYSVNSISLKTIPQRQALDIIQFSKYVNAKPL